MGLGAWLFYPEICVPELGFRLSRLRIEVKLGFDGSLNPKQCQARDRQLALLIKVVLHFRV